MTATDVDKTSPAASAAQELMLLGPNPSAYLDLDLIISKAKARGVVGIHPGWASPPKTTASPASAPNPASPSSAPPANP